MLWHEFLEFLISSSNLFVSSSPFQKDPKVKISESVKQEIIEKLVKEG
jgi:hypothetical protein